jgi:hypothetical protein
VSDPGLGLSSAPRSGLPFPARLPPRLVLCRSVSLIQLPSQFMRLLLDQVSVRVKAKGSVVESAR